MFTALAATSLASLAAGAYSASRAIANPPLSARDAERLYLPIFGVKESGKTLLLATLGDRLTRTSSEQLTTRLLSHKEEEAERGQALKPFDATDPAQPWLNPGERSTEAMIFFERRRFEQEGVNETTLKPEDALFKLQFSTRGLISGSKICKLEDVPGEQFMEERHHNANLHPKLARADGVVLVVDGPKALAAGDAPLAEHVLYRQALERYLAREDHGPVWVVVTKADLLPEESRGEAFWREHTLKHVTPLLKLEGSQVPFELSLVSARKECKGPWENIERAGEAFFVSLKGVLQRREEERARRESARRVAWMGSAAALLLSAVAGWAGVGARQVESLPRVTGEVAWDSMSLKLASEPRLRMLERSRGALSPLRLFEGRLRFELEVLRRAHWGFVRQLADEWAGGEGAGGVKEALEGARAFAEERASEEAWRDEERVLDERVSLALKHAKEISASDDEEELKGLIEQWTDRCALAGAERGSQRSFECALKLRASERLARVEGEHLKTIEAQRAKTLDEAARSPIRENDTIGLDSKLKPLMEWEVKHKGLPIEHPLLPQLAEYKARAWREAWEQLSARLDALKQPSEVAERLELLQAFELHRARLTAETKLNLEMPAEISKDWRERLNRECIEVKDGDLDLMPTQRKRADAIVEWADDFLDANRRARVRLRTREQGWREQLREGLSAAEPKRFDEALKAMKHDLDALSSEEGVKSIEEELKVWKNRHRDLSVWRAPREASLTASKVRCHFDRLEAEGIDAGAGSRWDMDKFSPYLLLSITPIGAEVGVAEPVGGVEGSEGASEQPARGLLLLGEVDEDDAPKVRWSPWSRVSFKLYELDGDVDSEPGVTERDDHLISDAGVWSVGSEPARASVKLTPQGGCVVDLIIDHKLADWVYSERLAERP